MDAAPPELDGVTNGLPVSRAQLDALRAESHRQSTIEVMISQTKTCGKLDQDKHEAVGLMPTANNRAGSLSQNPIKNYAMKNLFMTMFLS